MKGRLGRLNFFLPDLLLDPIDSSKHHLTRENNREPNRFFIVDEKVRREKALDFSGCNSRPGTGSLHPVAIEAAAEATKLSELSMERVTKVTPRACRP